MTDYAVGVTLDFFFTSRRFTTGAPFTLAGTPVISAYEDNGTTQITAGITLTADFDTVTGLNHVRVVATGGNGFEAGKSYALVITTGTVDSVSVVGEVIGAFTLERSAVFGRLGAPAGASVSADVAAVKAETASIQTDTNDMQTRLPAALVGGRMDSSTGAMAAAVVTAAAIATDALDADALAADALAEIADAVWDEDATGHQTGGTFGQAIGDPVADANTIFKAVVTDAAGATVGVDVVAVKAETASLQTDTNDLQTRVPAALTGAGNMKSDALAINGNTTSAAVLAILNGTTVVYQGTVTGAATVTTLIDSGLTQTDTDWWKGRIIIFTSVLTLQATDITAFDPATDKLTFTAVTTAPTGATYVII